MNTEILEKDHRLKYFYLLNSDFILQKIKASEEYTSYTRKKLPISELFNVIFTHILSGAKEYVEFVFYPDLFRRTIWGEPIQSSNLTGLSLLAGVTIRNHCILQGFFNALAREENALKRIKLSGANEALIKKGFFQTNEFQDKNNLEKETTIYQKYNAIMKRFKDNPDYYSSKILTSLSNDFSDFLQIPAYCSNWALFLLTEQKVNLLNKTLLFWDNEVSQRKNTMNHLTKNYADLFEKTSSWKKSLTSEFDQILFHKAIENIYGFSFFSNAARLLEEIHETPSNDEKSLKDLEGQSFLRLITRAATLPVLYNRHIFLDYAYQSILCSPNMESSYPPKDAGKALIRKSERKIPTEKLISSGLSLTCNYFQMLKYVTFPVLEDLWDVIIYKLNIKKLLKKYMAYIEKNFHIITFDYSSLDTNDIERVGTLKAETILDKFNSFDVSDLCGKRKPFDFKSDFSSTFTNSEVCQLLTNYFRFSRFDSKPHDYINNLLYPFDKTIDSIRSKIESTTFYENKINNIYNFLNFVP